MSIRLLICAEQPIVRAGLRAIIATEPGIVITGEPASAQAAVALVSAQGADAVLTGDLDGALDLVLSSAWRVLRDGRGSGVVTLIAPDDEGRVLAALRAGIQGVVYRDAGPAELVRAVRLVAAGQACLPPTVTRRLLEWSASVVSPAAGHRPVAVGTLSQSEMRVLRLLAEGMDGDQMAQMLGVTQATIRSHVHHMLTKLGLRSRSQAVAFAYQHGLLSPQGGERA
jgi:DNA-binding NarL/FixJ family response regulator